jgi:hypothetical protein
LISGKIKDTAASAATGTKRKKQNSIQLNMARKMWLAACERSPHAALDSEISVGNSE